jgi:hypothetical protein
MRTDVFNMQAAMKRQGLSVSVSGITAQVTTPGFPAIPVNSNSGSSSSSGGGSSGTSLGLIIGVVGGGVGGLVLAGILFSICKRCKVSVNKKILSHLGMMRMLLSNCVTCCSVFLQNKTLPDNNPTDVQTPAVDSVSNLKLM